MSSRLEDFFRKNRDAFDSEEPDAAVWLQIKNRMEQKPVTARSFRMRYLRWVAAAAVLVVFASGAIFFLRTRHPHSQQATVQGNSGTKGASEDLIRSINPDYAKEVYHFTQLIELKQNELRQIQKDEPALYEKFIDDINNLDSSYNALKKELPVNPNREQLLEAMIQNLRLQTELLNQQLMIIQKIKQSKNKTDESNSKTI